MINMINDTYYKGIKLENLIVNVSEDKKILFNIINTLKWRKLNYQTFIWTFNNYMNCLYPDVFIS